MLGDTAPALARIRARPDIATRRAEIKAAARMSIRAHRLTKHREPRLRARQSAIQTPPGLARVVRAIDGRLAVDRGTGPDRPAVHRKHPSGVGIGRMQYDRKADIADLLRHGLADADPAPLRPVEAIEPAVILMKQTIGLEGMQRDTMRIVAKGRRGVGQKVRRDSFVEGRPVASGVRGFEDAADRDANVEVLR